MEWSPGRSGSWSTFYFLLSTFYFLLSLVLLLRLVPARLGRCRWRRVARPRRPMIPILRARNVGHGPVVTVPSAEAVHLEQPRASIGIGDQDQAIGVAYHDAECTVVDARALPVRKTTEAGFVRALAGVVPS